MVPAAMQPPGTPAAAFKSQITSGYAVQQLEIKSGLLAHAQVHATFDVPPAVVFDVLNAPHDLHVAREVVECEPGRQVTAVTMRGDFRILMKRKEFDQIMRFEADARNPECLIHHYELQRSEVMHVQTGHWVLTPIRGASGQVEGTAGVYELQAQARVPAVIRRLPIAKKTMHRATMTLLNSYMQDHFGMIEGVKAGLTLQQARQRQNAASGSKGSNKGGKEATVTALGPAEAQAAAAKGCCDGKGPAAATTTVRAFLLDDVEDDDEDDTDGSSDTIEDSEALAQLV